MQNRTSNIRKMKDKGSNEQNKCKTETETETETRNRSEEESKARSASFPSKDSHWMFLQKFYLLFRTILLRRILPTKWFFFFSNDVVDFHWTFPIFLFNIMQNVFKLPFAICFFRSHFSVKKQTASHYIRC